MISIIKTAIITIVISFISGLLLEHYKNLGPRILYNIGNGMPININGKKIYTYIITVINISNKTIHDLTLNIQDSQNNLKIEDAKITRGLKFDSSIKDNILDVYIPFLSKDDEFSVKLCVENEHRVHNKPVVIIRSPENFKKVSSAKQNGILSLLSNIPKSTNGSAPKTMKKNEAILSNEKDDFTIVMDKVSDYKKTINEEDKKISYKNNKSSKNKKVVIIIASIILVMIIMGLGEFYFKGILANTQAHSVKANINKQSTDEAESAGGKAKNTDAKVSSDGTTKNTDAKASSDGKIKNTDTKSSTSNTTKSIDTKISTGGTTKNTDTKATSDGTTKNTDTKTPTDETTKNADTSSSTGGTVGNTNAKTSTDGATGNTSN